MNFVCEDLRFLRRSDKAKQAVVRWAGEEASSLTKEKYSKEVTTRNKVQFTSEERFPAESFENSITVILCKQRTYERGRENTNNKKKSDEEKTVE